MSGFQFRMNNILVIREKLEEKKKQEYGEAVSRLQIEEEKKQKLLDETNQLSRDLINKINEHPSPKEIISYNQYMSYLKRKTDEQGKMVLNAEKNMQKKHGELLEAVKQKKMLEVLKDKKWIEFQEESKREEQKQIDEIVSFQSRNQLRDGGKKNGRKG